MVEEELTGSPHRGAIVTISVPGGEEMAKETINARLGLIGGISIRGTTGVVRPYWTAAFKASVIQAIDVARERALSELVLTTGGKSEAFAMKQLPHLPEDAFIQMGDFVGTALKHCTRRNIRRAVIVGMIGKLSKMADGRMQTHAAGSEVNMELLAPLARESSGGKRLCAEIREADTSPHGLELRKAEEVRTGMDALRRGWQIVVEVKMIAAGLNEDRVRAYGCSTHCFISDDDVIAAAKAANSTRAIEAMRKAYRSGLLDGAIVAVGNPPTALLETVRLVEEAGARPSLVSARPRGFVSPAESNEAA